MKQAVEVVGVAVPTMYGHARRYPGFAAEIKKRGWLRGRRVDTGWHERFVLLVERNHSFAAAAEQIGVSDSTVRKHLRDFPGFRDKVRRLRPDGPLRKAPRTDWHPRLPELVRNGATLTKAAADLGISSQTISAHLRRYPELREAVRAARSDRS